MFYNVRPKNPGAEWLQQWIDCSGKFFCPKCRSTLFTILANDPRTFRVTCDLGVHGQYGLSYQWWVPYPLSNHELMKIELEK